MHEQRTSDPLGKRYERASFSRSRIFGLMMTREKNGLVVARGLYILPYAEIAIPNGASGDKYNLELYRVMMRRWT
jgi:hypothetical protein